jgi:L-iditol 2-dehydrogenase
MNRDIYWKILRKQFSVRGSWNSSYQSDWEMLVQNVDKLKLDSLISHRHDFAELDKALDMMHIRTEKRCKVVVNL